MEAYPPTYSSIALQKNKLDISFDNVFPFFVFLRTPAHYDYSFEVNQTDNITKAIEFISPKINVKSENITLLDIKTKNKIDNSSTFNDYQIGDILLVSHDGLIPDDDIPELPPDVVEYHVELSTDNLPKPEEMQPKPENQNIEMLNGFDDIFTPDDQENQNNENLSLNDITISDIRRQLTQKQRNFVSNLVSTYNLDEATVSQIFLICEKDEVRTEEMVAQMV